jgi:hypothetical protein
MGILEEMYVKAKTAFGILGGKAGQLVDISRLKIKIAEHESNQKREFEQLGRVIYFSKKNGNSDEADIDSRIAQIDELNEKVKYVRAEIDDLKNKIVCGNCKNKNEKDSSFCANCGTCLENSENKKNSKKKIK